MAGLVGVGGLAIAAVVKMRGRRGWYGMVLRSSERLDRRSGRLLKGRSIRRGSVQGRRYDGGWLLPSADQFHLVLRLDDRSADKLGQ